jgi:hypothetical protein
VVVFPAPFGPSSASVSPRAIGEVQPVDRGQCAVTLHEAVDLDHRHDVLRSVRGRLASGPYAPSSSSGLSADLEEDPVSITEHPRPRRRTPRRLLLGGLCGGLCAGLLVGCGVPIPSELPDTSGPRGGAQDSGSPTDRLIAIDDGSALLAGQLEIIAEHVRDVAALLRDATAAAEASAMDASRDAGATAVGRLLGPAGGGEQRGLIPAIEPDRSGAGSDDLITTLITAAGDVGGERARLVLELVRDPMLGDLGAWQRDPVGVITVLRTAVDAAEDAAALDAALLALPGELTRALGYAFAVTSTDDPVLAAHAARQAEGRLGVVLVAIELAVETLETAS